MSYRRQFLGFVGLLLLLNASAWIPHAAAVNVLILAGQSNMVGQANVTATLPGADPVDSQIRFYFDVTNTVAGFQDSSGQMFGPLRPWTFNASTSRFGPEMSLGRELATVDGLDLAMIKVAIGGSDIARWLPGAVDYNKLTSAVIDGIGELQTAGESVNVLGLVWLQGESDVISTARADAYAANLANFIGGFRGAMHSALPALGFDQLPTLLVEPADWRNGSSPGSATPANIAKVHNALMDFAAQDPRSWFIPTDDFNVFGDGLIHFGAADQMTLGLRIAHAVRTHLIPEPATGAQLLVAVALLRWRTVSCSLLGTQFLCYSPLYHSRELCAQ